MADTQEIKKDKSTEVLINGSVYRIGGADSAHIIEVASYLNDLIKRVQGIKGYGRLDTAQKELLINLNLTDEYFKARNSSEKYKSESEKLEKELYAVRHELVNVKLKLENAVNAQADAEKRCGEWENRCKELMETAEKPAAAKTASGKNASGKETRGKLDTAVKGNSAGTIF